MLAVIVILIVVAVFAKNHRRWRRAAQIGLAAIAIFYAISFSIGAATLRVTLTPLTPTPTIAPEATQGP